MSEDKWVYVMEVERKDDLFGIVATKQLQVMARDTIITVADMQEKLGKVAYDLLLPYAMGTKDTYIREHTCVESLETWGVNDWVVMYRECDLKAAGLLPNTEGAK